ncbi:MAG: DEAD/DEAH box helicase [Pirellulales bacterium]|nr:DEAD/DEAH box helicase [Pirellulales bacterium]
MGRAKATIDDALPGMEAFHACTRSWFSDALESPTRIQREAWPVVAAGKSALLLAPTGSGKTLAAFLAAIDRLMFSAAATGVGAGGAKSSEGDAAANAVAAQRGRDVFATGGSTIEARSPVAKASRPRSRAKRDAAPSQQEEGASRRAVRVVYVSPLKALAVDVDRNLRAPLVGIQAVAQRGGVAHWLPRVAVRSGDTSTAERREIVRQPPDILITTPESLYLLLTSRARDILRDVETVIVDEIHAVAATKRGSHLLLTLERLERLRRQTEAGRPPMQRIGLSATQRPLEEIARLLGGGEADGKGEHAPEPRPVEIVNASEPKRLDLRIETPVEDMARLSRPLEIQTGAAAGGASYASIWPSIHPRLVELIKAHRSTMVFVNSRRLAERLAAASNELAEAELAQAHHGSIARAKRIEIEDRLKRGQLPAIVATSSMELGVDMGAVDLVIQIEAPPSVASGMQRIGRAGHSVGAPSSGVIFPKYRGDLVACSAAAQRMVRGEVESTRYPRNPLDVLAQQIVAMAAMDGMTVDEVYSIVRGAAPFFDLPRSSFEGVLDMLSGRYPSDEFSELRPRITWDRLAGTVAPRKSSQRLAVLNGGTIPDRGLYGVYLAGEAGSGGTRVGELDEEMVFETHAGDVFLLGASSWRVLEITRDRVLVAPAPGEPGKMPFWHGDGPGRPLDFGRAIGELCRRLARMPRDDAAALLRQESRLDAQATENLLGYVDDQREATGELPSDQCIVVESFLDGLGDWRTVILSPFGSRVHAPWAIAAAGRLRAATGLEVDFTWSDDGMVFRLPESERPPAFELLFPSAQEVEDQVVRELGSTALFAARFRENAARALLLPRKQPGRRTPLWMQRRRSADLLAVASRYERFPIMLETYRECLRDVFDVPGLVQLLGEIERQQLRVHAVETDAPSPFAGALMFNYTANFLYQGDAPLAERRAAALALDYAQLRELLGTADYRELLDGDAIDAVAMELQRLEHRSASGPDGVHDLLLHVGDLSEEELAARCPEEAVRQGELQRWIGELLATRRIMKVRIAGERRLAAAEDAARLRDGLGAALPPGLPEAFLEPCDDPLGDLVSRYARTHGPFRAMDAAARLGIGEAAVAPVLQRLMQRNRVVAGEFLPGGNGHEWCDAAVLRRIKSKSLARLRQQIEPVAPTALARFLPAWQGVERPRRGLDGLLDVVEQLQGVPLLASDLDELILPARLRDYQPGALDEIAAAGEIVWRGIESVGPSDGRVALYLTHNVPLLAPPPAPVDDPLAEQIREFLRAKGASFFDDMAVELGGFRNDVFDSLWRLVWAGHVTNDTLSPLRSRRRQAGSAGPGRAHRRRGEAHRERRGFRSRRAARHPAAEGRWSLINYGPEHAQSATARQTALAEQLIRRYGVLVRSAVNRELVEGGFAGLYPVLRAMEEAGRIRRGYFVAGMGGAQFASPGSDETLRRPPKAAEVHEDNVTVLAASDPANAYGSILKWPATSAAGMQLQRGSGARVLLLEGRLIGYLGRSGNHLLTFSPEDPSDEPLWHEKLVRGLARLAKGGAPVLIAQIDGQAAGRSPLAPVLARHGFSPTSRGYLHRIREGRQGSLVDEAWDPLLTTMDTA